MHAMLFNLKDFVACAIQKCAKKNIIVLCKCIRELFIFQCVDLREYTKKRLIKANFIVPILCKYLVYALSLRRTYNLGVLIKFIFSLKKINRMFIDCLSMHPSQRL